MCNEFLLIFFSTLYTRIFLKKVMQVTYVIIHYLIEQN